MLWLIKKGKLIVTGFSPASAAKELGVKMGDILKSVDGHNVLFMVPDEEVRQCCRRRAGLMCHEGAVAVGSAFGDVCKFCDAQRERSVVLSVGRWMAGAS